MEPIIKICGLTKTYQSKERVGLFGSRVKQVDALKDVMLDISLSDSFHHSP